MRDKLVSLCREMIQIPSMPGQEKNLADFLLYRLESLAFDTVERDEFGSVIGTIRNGDGPAIVFDAHLDTVSPEPESEWSRPPYAGTVEDGVIHGRGAMDMKGPAAAMILALSSLADTRNFSGTIVASLSTMEEVVEAAALKHVLARYPADALIICEASSCNVVRAQRGRAEIVLTTKGVKSHSSHPEHGLDAVELMVSLLDKVKAMRLPSHPLVGNGIQVLTGLVSEPQPAMSTVPHGCRANIDRRLIPGESRHQLVDEYQKVIGEMAFPEGGSASMEIDSEELTAYTGHRFSVEHFFPAWEMDEAAPLVADSLKAIRSEAFSGCRLSHYGFCTNGSLGDDYEHIPRIGFGPGEETMAHRADECVAIDELVRACKGYMAIAKSALKA